MGRRIRVGEMNNVPQRAFDVSKNSCRVRLTTLQRHPFGLDKVCENTSNSPSLRIEKDTATVQLNRKGW